MAFIITKWANDWGNKNGIYGFATKDVPAGQHDDLDAFRHAFCHAYVMGWLSFTERSKDVSDYIGMIMEIPELSGVSGQPCAAQMDYHNNKVGQTLAPTSSDMWSIIRYGENPTPYIAKRIAAAVKARETINSFDDPRMAPRCRKFAKLAGEKYIWRTKKDDKVRWDHAVREGKIFSLNTPPEGGNPGSHFNCRCWAEPLKDDEI